MEMEKRMGGILIDDGHGAAREISLGDNFGEVVVKANGASVQIHADGTVEPCAKGLPANDSAAKGKTAPEIGDEMEDGTILAGYYEGKPLYATPKDAPGTYTFNQAAKYAKNLDAHGHHDFHAPSKGELNVLYQNRDKGKLKGTFNETGSNPAGWYWSSSPDGNYGGAWAQRFSDGNQYYYHRGYDSSLRCVR